MLEVDCGASIDELEQQLLVCESEISRLRQKQADLLANLDSRQVHRLDGARSLQEWVRARLDVTAQTARDLVDASRTLPIQPELTEAADGLSFERIVATSRLLAAGADQATVRRSFGYDLAGVDRLRGRHRRITRSSERDRFVDRSVYSRTRSIGLVVGCSANSPDSSTRWCATPSRSAPRCLPTFPDPG
jgi:hypothetical protein